MSTTTSTVTTAIRPTDASPSQPISAGVPRSIVPSNQYRNRCRHLIRRTAATPATFLEPYRLPVQNANSARFSPGRVALGAALEGVLEGVLDKEASWKGPARDDNRSRQARVVLIAPDQDTET
ncbi:hypothetical protein GCM10010522_01060 [Kribbella solani]